MSTLVNNRWQDRLGRFGARLSPGAGGFFSWWGQALSAWLPARVRLVLGLDRGRLLLQVGADPSGSDTLQLRLQQGDTLRDLGHLPALADDLSDDPLTPILSARLADLPRWLLLPAASALRRRLQLPAAAAERLRDVVGFEIDRQTPFATDAVAYDARVLGRREGEAPRDDKQIDVELVAVPRHVLDPQLAALGPLAPTLAGIDVAGTDGVPLAVNLLAPAQRHRGNDAWRLWNWALAALALLALVLTGWTLLENRRSAADAFEADITQGAAAAGRAAGDRQQLQDLIAGQAFLERARAERPTAVEVMEELSRRLPDGTYLEKLAIENERLTLIGLSNEAPALIGRLQDSKLWRSPGFAGALQTDPATRKDRFTLIAELGPAPAKAEASRASSRP